MKHLIILFLFIPFLCYGQEFEINDFPNYEIRRQNLNFRFDSYSSTTSERYSANETNLYLGTFHNYRIRKENLQIDQEANVSWQLGNDLMDNINVRNEFSYRGYSDSIDYLLFEWNHYRSLTKERDQNPFRNRYDNVVTFGFGTGRIDDYSDTYHTYNILKLLKKRGLSEKSLNTSQFQKLINKVSEIKNKRIPDFRFRNIYETEQLLTYFDSIGFFNSSDFMFIAHLLDVWDYERQFIEFGSRYEFSYTNHWFNNDYYFDFNTIIGHQLRLGYIYQAPLTNELIFKLSNSLAYEILINKDTENSDSKNLIFNQLGSLEYLFSSRLSIENSIQTDWYMYREINFGNNPYASSFNYEIKVHWFFTPFTTLSLLFRQNISYDSNFSPPYSRFEVSLRRGFY